MRRRYYRSLIYCPATDQQYRTTSRRQFLHSRVFCRTISRIALSSTARFSLVIVVLVWIRTSCTGQVVRLKIVGAGAERKAGLLVLVERSMAPLENGREGCVHQGNPVILETRQDILLVRENVVAIDLSCEKD
jgi:hypothetical protein